jgi:hypothetical protein
MLEDKLFLCRFSMELSDARPKVFTLRQLEQATGTASITAFIGSVIAPPAQLDVPDL